MTKWKEIGKIACLFTLCALMAVVAAQVTIQPKLLSTSAGAAVQPLLEETTASVKETHAAISTIKDLTAEIKLDYESNQENLTANADSTTVLIKSLTDTVTDLHVRLFGGQDCRKTKEKLPSGWKKLDCVEILGLFPQTDALLKVATSWMTQLKADTHELLSAAAVILNSTDEALKPLKADLEKLGVLEDDLDKAIRAGSDQTGAIATKIETTIGHIDDRLKDPNIEKIVADLSKTTHHFGEIAETTDIATRGLRKQVGKVKWVIHTLGNFLKATIRIY